MAARTWPSRQSASRRPSRPAPASCGPGEWSPTLASMAPATLHLEDLWIKNVTITMGLVDGTTVPMLLALVREGKIRPEMFGTHDFNLQDTMGAYDVFAEAGKTNALKVVIKR